MSNCPGSARTRATTLAVASLSLFLGCVEERPQFEPVERTSGALAISGVPPLSSDLAVTKWGVHRSDLFGIDAAGQMWHGWSNAYLRVDGWERLGAPVRRSIRAHRRTHARFRTTHP